MQFIINCKIIWNNYYKKLVNKCFLIRKILEINIYWKRKLLKKKKNFILVFFNWRVLIIFFNWRVLIVFYQLKNLGDGNIDCPTILMKIQQIYLQKNLKIISIFYLIIIFYNNLKFKIVKFWHFFINVSIFFFKF